MFVVKLKYKEYLFRSHVEIKWCVDYTEFCLVIKFKHKIPSVCMQKIFLLALWSQKIKYFMQPCCMHAMHQPSQRQVFIQTYTIFIFLRSAYCTLNSMDDFILFLNSMDDFILFLNSIDDFILFDFYISAVSKRCQKTKKLYFIACFSESPRP